MEFRLTNPLYVENLSCCTLRLEDVSQQPSPRETRIISDCIKRMALKLSGHHFLGENPIMVIHFVTLFVREANIQEICKAWAFVALPPFLRRFVKSRYEAGSEMMIPEEGGISSWGEAVQYLIKNYAQSSRISLAIANLLLISQELMESEG